MAYRAESAGPIYTAIFHSVSITSGCDFFQIKAPANTSNANATRVAIREVVISQVNTAPIFDMLDLEYILFTGSTAAGSGGTTATPTNIAPWTGSTVAQTSAVTCNTTKAGAGNGTSTTPRAEGWNAAAPYHYYPGFRGERILLDFGQMLAVRLATPVSATTNFSGTIVFEEIGAAGI